MSLIQITLVIGALCSLGCYLFFLRSALTDRLIAIVFFAVIVFLILFPESSSVLAHKLGVGRGTDLVFYLFAITSVFVFVLLYSKIESTNEKLTDLVRINAIQNAYHPKESVK
jgi:hypothetical protein